MHIHADGTVTGVQELGFSITAGHTWRLPLSHPHWRWICAWGRELQPPVPHTHSSAYKTPHTETPRRKRWAFLCLLAAGTALSRRCRKPGPELCKFSCRKLPHRQYEVHGLGAGAARCQSCLLLCCKLPMAVQAGEPSSDQAQAAVQIHFKLYTILSRQNACFEGQARFQAFCPHDVAKRIAILVKGGAHCCSRVPISPR